MERNRAYIGNRNKRNVIGNGLPWYLEEDRVTRKKYCALKADVCGFSKVMEEGATRTLAIKKKLAELATTEVLGCESVSYAEGDAISALERSAERAAEAAFRILDQVRRLGLEVRIALDFGLMTIAGPGEMTGTPFLHCARVEPLVEPNQIWCTEAFARELERLGSIYRGVDLFEATPASLLPRKTAEGFSVGKEGQPGLELRLYRVLRD
jgi:hypothetical protein